MERDSCIFFIVFAVDDLQSYVYTNRTLALGILKNTASVGSVCHCLNCVFKSVNAADDNVVTSCSLCCGKSSHTHIVVLADDSFQLVAVSCDPVLCKSHSLVSLPVSCLHCNNIEVVKNAYFLEAGHTSNLSGLSHGAFDNSHFVAFFQAGFLNEPCSQKFSGFLIRAAYKRCEVGVRDIAVVNNDGDTCVICHGNYRRASFHTLRNNDESVHAGCKKCLAVADLFVYVAAGVVYKQLYAQFLCSRLCGVHDSGYEHIGIIFG